MWLENQKAETQMAAAAQRETRVAYSVLLQQLIEKSNVREAEHKAHLASVEGENRRLKVVLDGISTLEYSFLEARALLIQMQEVRST